MNSLDQYIGGEFAWFTGVVEDIIDPMQMGRVRVRCFGYHTDDKAEIPTESLPWALVMTPVTSAGMSGIGQSATGVLRGSWVIGFFRDGKSAQDPIVMGTVPSMTMGGNPLKGFSDPSNVHPKNPGTIDLPKESRSEFSKTESYIKRKQLRQEKIETAIPGKLSSVAVPEASSYYTRNTWSNWDVDTIVNPIYPSNHSFHSESGHVKEMDDTSGAERLFEMHKSGTYYEIDYAGNKTTTVVGNNYTVIIGADNIYIKGSANLTVDGDFRHLIKGNYHLEVEGNKTEYIKGSRQSKIGKSEQIEIGQEFASNITSNSIERIGGNATILIDRNKAETVGGNLDLFVGGDDSHIVVGKRQEFTGSHLELTTNGHLVFVSKEYMKIESLSTLNMTIDGAVTETFGSTQNTTVSGAISVNGSSTIGVTASGAVTINGSTINLN